MTSDNISCGTCRRMLWICLSIAHYALLVEYSTALQCICRQLHIYLYSLCGRHKIAKDRSTNITVRGNRQENCQEYPTRIYETPSFFCLPQNSCVLIWVISHIVCTLTCDLPSSRLQLILAMRLSHHSLGVCNSLVSSCLNSINSNSYSYVDR